MKYKAETKEDVARVINILSIISLDRPKQIVITDYVRDRSAAQSRLYWKWIGEIARHLADSTGHIADGKIVSEQMKEWLYPQIVTDKPLIIEYEYKGEARIIYESTAKLSVKVMAMYMDILEMTCIARLGLQLSHNTDDWYEAMGREK